MELSFLKSHLSKEAQNLIIGSSWCLLLPHFSLAPLPWHLGPKLLPRQWKSSCMSFHVRGLPKSPCSHWFSEVPLTSLAGQWLRLPAPNAGSTGLIPGRELRSHMLNSVAKKLKEYWLFSLWDRKALESPQSWETWPTFHVLRVMHWLLWRKQTLRGAKMKLWRKVTRLLERSSEERLWAWTRVAIVQLVRLGQALNTCQR